MGDAYGTTDDEVMRDWYGFASGQAGFIGPLMRNLRERSGESAEHQRMAFGLDERAFLHLEGMPLPRPDRFASDAHRIALRCGAGDPVAVVRALLLARDLGRAAAGPPAQGFYRAALDADEDLVGTSDGDERE
jgi:hypothetical protein